MHSLPSSFDELAKSVSILEIMTVVERFLAEFGFK